MPSRLCSNNWKAEGAQGKGTSSALKRVAAENQSGSTPSRLCKVKRQYLLTCKVSRYCLLALHGVLLVHQTPPDRVGVSGLSRRHNEGIVADFSSSATRRNRYTLISRTAHWLDLPAPHFSPGRLPDFVASPFPAPRFWASPQRWPDVGVFASVSSTPLFLQYFTRTRASWYCPLSAGLDAAQASVRHSGLIIQMEEFYYGSIGLPPNIHSPLCNYQRRYLNNLFVWVLAHAALAACLGGRHAPPRANLPLRICRGDARIAPSAI